MVRILSPEWETTLEYVGTAAVACSTLAAVILLRVMFTTTESLLSRGYKILMVAILINGLAIEYCGFFVVRFIPLFPLPCFFSGSGLKSSLGIDGHLGMVIEIQLFNLIAVPYGLCFAYRHQHLQPFGSPYRFRPVTIVILTLLFMAFTFNQSLYAIACLQPHADTVQLLTTQAEDVTPRILNNSYCYKAPNHSELFVMLVAAMILVSIGYIVLVTAHIYYTLHVHLDTICRLSFGQRRQYWSAVKGLLAQAIVPLSILLAPSTVWNIQIALDIDSPALAVAAPVITLFHSTAYSIVVLLTTAPYRRRLMQSVASIRSKQSADRIQVSSICTTSSSL